MREQAKLIHPLIMPELTKNFGEFEYFLLKKNFMKILRIATPVTNLKAL